jgi:tetratricopeptide (TPR) repeat protein
VYYCPGPQRHSWAQRQDARRCCNGYVRRSRTIRTDSGDVRLEFYWERLTDAAPDTNAGGGGDPGDDDLPTPADPDTVRRTAAGISPYSHHPFFARLATVEQDSSTWRTLTAALLTLRLVDRWVMRTDEERRPSFREYVMVRRAVDEVDVTHSRAVLHDLTRTLHDYAGAGARSVPALLVELGRLLEDAAEWAVAADVYETVIAHARIRMDHTDVPLCYDRMGYCLRQDGRVDEAASAYARGRAVAHAAGDAAGVLRLRVSDANLALHRGDLHASATMLDAVIADARRGGHREPLALAAHDRGVVAFELGELDRAALFLHDAVESYDEPARQQRAMVDLARTLRALGARDAARDAFSVLYASADQRDCKWGAAINLLDLAVSDGDEPAFEILHQAIEAEQLPVRLQAQFYRTLALGFRGFGHVAKAELTWRVLSALANRHGLTEFVPPSFAHDATPGPVATLATKPVPDTIARVVSALQQRRARL